MYMEIVTFLEIKK